jgi:UDP-2,4-diacetamido-2,4,6-trideoxy-beta-L-altropyranose hydrolase
MRCLTLADALAQEGWQCVFACSKTTKELVPGLGDSDYNLVEVGGAVEEQTVALKEACPDGVGLMVVDHYGLDTQFESACRNLAEKVLVVDDLADREHDCDLLLDQTVERAASDYVPLVPPDCRVLTGGGYALLRPEFAHLRPQALERRGSGRLGKILIHMGLGDPANVTGLALDAVTMSGLDAEVDVIVSGTSPHLERLRSCAARMHRQVRIHADTRDVAVLMMDADLCIGAGGTASWERCCLGLPTVLVEIAANQQLVTRNLERIGAALRAGTSEQVSRESLAATVFAIARDAERRARMSAAAASVCDGLGRRRVALEIRPEADNQGQLVTLRTASADDAILVYDWQRQPGMRRHFLNPNVPTWTEHRSWFSRRLADPRCDLSIILRNGSPAGFLRLEPIRTAEEAQSRQVAILIDRNLQGWSTGTAALKAVRRIYPETVLTAKILPANTASLAAFSKAGYQQAAGAWVSRP